MAWKHGKQWVYSITYDEGCELLLEHALPLHRKYGIPGHVALVASQIGQPRDVPGSSYNGLMILSAEQVRALCAEGWGVSCHGLTHGPITPETAWKEVVEARAVLGQALGMPITIFCVPGNNDNWPAAAAVAPQAGYKAILTIYDRVNTLDSNLFCLGRVPLHAEYPPPFYSAFDPYKRLHQAIDLGGWVIDYCHCPLPAKPIHPWKDCTLEQLEERFQTVLRVGGDDVWLAEPGEVVEYILQTRSARSGNQESRTGVQG
ncbi:MAG: polysaccharide deacetylase family protein [Armatimonadetes bacterium]|nr:polysaccharide deacetylase family protein [Armatimonadota bacterium]